MTPETHRVLERFHPVVAAWFQESFCAPTPVQVDAWPPIASGRSVILLAPTGSGKTLAAFLHSIDRLCFRPIPEKTGTRVLYISPLKALGADIERNLRAPLAGITRIAESRGIPFYAPRVGIRSGDTPSQERRRMLRNPPDILITTPESLFLMLTSQARASLRNVETVIVDEIHTMSGTKRGAHLFLSLERLEAIVRRPLQRIGLSATQRPADLAARLLGGGRYAPEDDRWTPRPVEIVDRSAAPSFELRIEVPQSDEAEPDSPTLFWPNAYERMLDAVRSHRSTMIFVNSRGEAERVAQGLNEAAGETIALAHHGSMARDERRRMEDALKAGSLPALVATSSMELGVDMGAVDLVIQIGAPPSVASGLQRVGRAGHGVGQTSRALFLPKFPGDLVTSVTIAEKMRAEWVETTRAPDKPLDVLAQHIVAIVAEREISVGELFVQIKGATAFRNLSPDQFRSVLAMLSGEYPDHELAAFRPRINWDRRQDLLAPRRGSQAIAVANAGTIPDRGLYGVFLSPDEEGTRRRVGELDEEMVFETQVGDVIVLGASSWRVEDITHDRVLVRPAPGEPGKMPFWHGEGPGRPAELGIAQGKLLARLADRPANPDVPGLSPAAAERLRSYVARQQAAGAVPTHRQVVIERFTDEIGDWRICILAPFGAPVLAPWGLIAQWRLRQRYGAEVDVTWNDDGICFRLPATPEPPEIALCQPTMDDLDGPLVAELPKTALFSARFRENAARALLLVRRAPGKRQPLWAQRRRAADLLQAAVRYPNFPLVLETLRACLQDHFDIPALRHIIQDLERGQVVCTAVDSPTPSPFASALLYQNVGQFIYAGDTPLAERRAQLLSIDYRALRDLLGEEDLRHLFPPEIVASVIDELHNSDRTKPPRDADDIFDRLLEKGELALESVRAMWPDAAPAIDRLIEGRRGLVVSIGSAPYLILARDAGLYRDALGVSIPAGLPSDYTAFRPDALEQLITRFARTRGPFSPDDVAAHYGLGRAVTEPALMKLAGQGLVTAGAFSPERTEVEYCDPAVLRRIKGRTLARMRREVEPVTAPRFAAFRLEWHGLIRPNRGIEALYDAIEQLQGESLPLRDLEFGILARRVADYQPAMLDELLATGEVLWRGTEAVGDQDGRVALYFRSDFDTLAPPPQIESDPTADAIRECLKDGGRFFFELRQSVGGLSDTLARTLWQMVWAGEISNDSWAPVRSKFQGRRLQRHAHRFHARRQKERTIPGTEGRWRRLDVPAALDAKKALAQVEQALVRDGVLMPRGFAAGDLGGGFSRAYPILKMLEKSGKVHRGYFVEGLGGAQFALPAAEGRLRAAICPDGEPRWLRAADPANPYGRELSWPPGRIPWSRSIGADVLFSGRSLLAYLSRSHRKIWVASDQPEDLHTVAESLASAPPTSDSPAPIEQVNDAAAKGSALAEACRAVGLRVDTRGIHRPRPLPPTTVFGGRPKE